MTVTVLGEPIRGTTLLIDSGLSSGNAIGGLNLGTGTGVYASVNNSILNFKSILNSPSVTVSSTTNDITLSVPSGYVTGLITNSYLLNTLTLTSNRGVITDNTGKLIASSVTATEFSYLTGASSNLQTQINNRLIDPMTTIGDIVFRNGSNVTSRLPIGANGTVLSVTGGLPTWTTSGTISGLTTWTIPKAGSPSTLINSIITETSGAINIAGTLDANGGIRTNGGAFLLTKIIQIGDWNMGAVATKAVPHGLGSNYTKIRMVDVMLIADVGVGAYLTQLSTTFVNYPTSTDGVVSIDNTNINLARSGTYYPGSGTHNNTSYNRGWITITYEA